MSKRKDKKIIEQAINRMHKRFSLKLNLDDSKKQPKSNHAKP